MGWVHLSLYLIWAIPSWEDGSDDGITQTITAVKMGRAKRQVAVPHEGIQEQC